MVGVYNSGARRGCGRTAVTSQCPIPATFPDSSSSPVNPYKEPALGHKAAKSSKKANPTNNLPANFCTMPAIIKVGMTKDELMKNTGSLCRGFQQNHRKATPIRNLQSHNPTISNLTISNNLIPIPQLPFTCPFHRPSFIMQCVTNLHCPHLPTLLDLQAISTNPSNPQQEGNAC